MGADMIANYLCIDKGRKPMSQKELYAIAEEYVNSLSQEELHFEEWDWIGVDFDDCDVPCSDEHIDRSRWVTCVVVILYDIEKMMNGQWYRELSDWVIGEYLLIITGGMTSGDDPTQAFGVLNNLDNMPRSNELHARIGSYLLGPHLLLTPVEPVPKFETVEEADAYLEGRTRPKFKEVAEIVHVGPQ